MAKTIAEIRTSKSVGLPERTYPLCMAGKLAAEIEELEAELDLIEDRPQSARVGAKTPLRKLTEQIEALRDEMNDHLIAVRLRAKPGHEWRAFLADRPARDGEIIDQRTGVDIDAFIRDMHEFVVTISDQPLEAGDWEFITANAADGDLKGMVGLLIDMHNRGVDIPKSRLSSRTPQETSND